MLQHQLFDNFQLVRKNPPAVEVGFPCICTFVREKHVLCKISNRHDSLKELLNANEKNNGEDTHQTETTATNSSKSLSIKMERELESCRLLTIP